MPHTLTNDEAAELKRLFDKATGLQLQMPSSPKATSWITEFFVAVKGPFQHICDDADPRKTHERVKRPWHP
jgi:hypothetical protein